MAVLLKTVNNSLTHAGYCHELTITIKANSTTLPTSICLGNYGDDNITRLTFDLSELMTTGILTNSFDDYIYKIAVYDPAKPADHEHGTNPKVFVINRIDWPVPEALTTFSQNQNLELVLIILEPLNETYSTTGREIFISDKIKATVNPTLWQAGYQDLIDATDDEEDNEGYFAKDPIILTPTSDHYKVLANGKILGNKVDQYITRINLNNAETALDEGLDARFAIFKKDNTVYCSKFHDTTNPVVQSCWIPPEVTQTEGEWKYFVVAQTCEYVDLVDEPDDGFKRWVGNELSGTISDNFLIKTDLFPALQTPTYELNGLTMYIHAADYDTTSFDIYDNNEFLLNKRKE